MIDRLLLTGWLFVVWVLLWGSLTPAVLLSGVVVAPLCLAASRLPAVRLTSRLRPVTMLRALAGFVVDVVRSTAGVAWTVLRRGRATRSAVVAVRLPAPGPASDLAVALAANRLSLVPGTLVVDIDRDRDTFYVYVLDVRSDEDVQAARRDAERAVADVLAAAGHPATGGREVPR
ncbi:Na+/H+ antiporter subunit E [Blastococcus tunisiensis]|uniref:Multisubunit sodium/proton antiporter, MrpE subunit n=1 Tax=Blastococcus tunisiensis TaxID=1798228 RepID=A0A1I2DUJ7_9ACTN|nr:Na+/H+ antiporter subunit E [Blastococcus sp. DSM 46838]SFE83911.1 multisubunit sodium/proton antiporter, MrpE subunit [Blastococcus sp. DSM 46838]